MFPAFEATAGTSPSQLYFDKIADGVAMGLVGIAEDCNVDEMGWCPIRPNMAIDLTQIDFLAPPLADVLITAVGDIMGKPVDIFVVPGFEPIAPDDLHPALLPRCCAEDQEQAGGVVVAFAHVLVERAFDGLLDVPAPNQEWIIGHVEIDVAEEHRGGRPGLEAQRRHAVLDGEGHLHWSTRPEFAVVPTRWQ